MTGSDGGLTNRAARAQRITRAVRSLLPEPPDRVKAAVLGSLAGLSFGAARLAAGDGTGRSLSWAAGIAIAVVVVQLVAEICAQWYSGTQIWPATLRSLVG